MRVLVACEFSGVVRRAFARRGHDAWSVDLLPSEDRSNRHIVGDFRDHLDDGWDLLMVAHPPCTRLCKSGLRWLHSPPRGRSLDQMWRELDEAADLFSAAWNARQIPRRAIENPRMHRHAQQRIKNFRPPTQVIQPWQFGVPQTKATCLWIDGLMPLRPTQVLAVPTSGSEEWRRWSRVHRMPERADRWRERSRTPEPIGEAMAEQWGGWADERATA